MTTGQLVGIIIVNYNGRPFIMDCLDSLLQIDYQDTRVVVVDNASTDGSPEYISEHYPSVMLIRLSVNRGFTGGNNEGIRWCLDHGCDYVLLLNSDTIVNPDSLSCLMTSSEKDCLLVPKIYFQNARLIINNMVGSFDCWRGIIVPWFYGKEDSRGSTIVRYATMASACVLLIPCAVVETVGYFDEQYFLYWEDIDLVTRALKKGVKIKFVPAAVVYHNESSSMGGAASPLTLYYNHRNRLYFMFKHQKNKFALGFFILYFFVGRIVSALKYILRGDTASVDAMFKGIGDYFRGRMGQMPPRDSRQLSNCKKV